MSSYYYNDISSLSLLLCGMFIVVEGHTEVNQNLRLIGADFDTTTANLVGTSMDG